MSKTDPKDDPKKLEFFEMLDEYFEQKKETYKKAKKENPKEGTFLQWLGLED